MTYLRQTNVEKVTLVNGDVYLLDAPRFRHAMDGKVFSGFAVTNQGERTTEQYVLQAADIASRVAMAMTDQHDFLVEAPDLVPFADRIY